VVRVRWNGSRHTFEALHTYEMGDHEVAVVPEYILLLHCACPCVPSIDLE
jgi:hypothetical protein